MVVSLCLHKLSLRVICCVVHRMLRQPLTRALALGGPRVTPLAARRFADQVPAQPDKVELFIDDKPVYVAPGTTVLQVTI